MPDMVQLLYDAVKPVMQTWDEDGIYAISFFVYSNEAFEYRGYKNVSIFEISYNTESDCPGTGPGSEERWEYAYWRQNTTPIISVDEPDPLTDALFDWYAEQGIDDIGYEDPDGMYDENMMYIGSGPAGNKELVDLAAEVALRLRCEGFVDAQFGPGVPILIHGLETTGYELDATKRANPNGEADNYLKFENGIADPFADADLLSSMFAGDDDDDEDFEPKFDLLDIPMKLLTQSGLIGPNCTKDEFFDALRVLGLSDEEITILKSVNSDEDFGS